MISSPPAPPAVMKRAGYGVAVCLIASVVLWRLSTLPWNNKLQLSPLMLGILGGMALGNGLSGERLGWLSPGMRFAQQKILRAGIVLYGLRVTLQELFGLGPRALALDLMVIASVVLIGYRVGTRVFGLDSDTALLVSMGSGVCGAAAVVATDRVIDSETHKVGVAVATVTLFGTVAMFLYPMLYPITGFSERQFGIYTGATVHEVAQVVAAGRAVSGLTGDTAVITKMLRVVLLAPLLFIVGRVRGRRNGVESNPISFPWFVLGFLAVVAIESLNAIPSGIRLHLIDLDTVLLGTAMFALGVSTRWSHVRQAGSQPLLLGAFLFVCLVGGGYLLTRLVVR